MRDAAAELAAALESALASFAEAVTGAAPGWVVFGVILHLASQVARGRGWCTLLRCASAEPVRNRDPILAWIALAVARSPRLRGIAAGVGRGCAPLREPRAYARGVLPWQLASRVCRLGALACFLAAFGLPATPAAVLLVVGAQTGGRLLPFAPASVGAGAAMLAAAFAPVTGAAVPAGQVAAFFVGTSAVLTAVGSVLALAICLRAVSWRHLL